MRLQKKLAFCVIAAAFVGLVVAAPVTFMVADQMLLDLKEKQLRSELNDIGNSITNLIGVGLPLSALRRTQDLIERGRSRNPQIGAIVVFDTGGQILYSTDLGEVGLSVPAPWRQRESVGSFRTDEELVAIAPLFNSFGSRVGGVVLRYALSNQTSLREELWLLIAGVEVLVLVATAALADWMSGSVTRNLRGGIDAVIADMEAMLAGRPSPGLPSAAPLWVLGRYRPFADRAQSTLVRLDGYTRDLTRIDETG
jgi:hypothetical protein